MTIKILTVEAMRQAEAAADAAGYSYAAMMNDAGRAAASRALELITDRPEAKVTILVGAGNNGGDGLVAGRYIAQERPDVQVRFYLLTNRDDDNFKAVQEMGLFIAYAADDHDNRVLRNMVASADLVLDALFGIGVRLPIKDAALRVLRGTQQALNERATARRSSPLNDPTQGNQVERPSRTYVLAIDCPSGLNCDTGELDKNALTADETVTFIAAKPGLLEFPGATAVGRLHVAPLEMPENIDVLDKAAETLLDNDTVRDLLPERPADGHKGTFGKVMVVAGSINYTGAPGLSAMSAYRAGAGLVTVAAPGPVVSVLAGKFLEPTWLLLPHDLGVIGSTAAKVVKDELATYKSLLIGPGMGRESITRDMLRDLLGTKSTAQRRVIGFGLTNTSIEEETTTSHPLPPLVIDADGLNLLSEIENWSSLLPKDTILTPHPGEMARLCGNETADVQRNRRKLALEKAAQWNAIVVLKGAHTLVASPDGKLAVSPVKTDALAHAGTGDVLAGLIAGLLAQGLNPFAAAQVGVYVHGIAGLLAERRVGSGRSVLAGDVSEAIPQAFAAIEAG